MISHIDCLKNKLMARHLYFSLALKDTDSKTVHYSIVFPSARTTAIGIEMKILFASLVFRIRTEPCEKIEAYSPGL